jgi:hypothetical protein
VRPGHIYVAEIRYTLDPGLTKLHLSGFRYWHLDANQKPTPGDMITADTVVPLYDTPQANWPCTKPASDVLRQRPVKVAAGGPAPCELSQTMPRRPVVEFTAQAARGANEAS